MGCFGIEVGGGTYSVRGAVVKRFRPSTGKNIRALPVHQTRAVVGSVRVFRTFIIPVPQLPGTPLGMSAGGWAAKFAVQGLLRMLQPDGPPVGAGSANTVDHVLNKVEASDPIAPVRGMAVG